MQCFFLSLCIFIFIPKNVLYNIKAGFIPSHNFFVCIFTQYDVLVTNAIDRTLHGQATNTRCILLRCWISLNRLCKGEFARATLTCGLISPGPLYWEPVDCVSQRLRLPIVVLRERFK